MIVVFAQLVTMIAILMRRYGAPPRKQTSTPRHGGRPNMPPRSGQQMPTEAAL
jgi:hypothetical protein